MTATGTTLFLNWLILHAAGLSSQLIIFNRCFSLRHNYTLWALYFGIRGIIRAYMSAYLGSGTMSQSLYAFDVVFVLVTAVANLAVLWYTWEADIIKTGIVGVVSDLLTGTAMVICIGMANLSGHGRFAPDMNTLSMGCTVAAAAGLVLVVYVMARLLDPVLRWFRKAELQRRGLISAILIIGISLFSSTNLMDSTGFEMSSYVVFLIGVIMLLPLGAYSIKMIDIQRNRRMLLRQRAEMSSAYILAVDTQAESIASHRQLLDSVSALIDSSELKLTSNTLSTYIQDLKARADMLKSGRYSSSIAVDAILSAYSARFEAIGYCTNFRTDTIYDDETEAAEVSWVLLNWAECIAAKSGKSTAGDRTKTVRYRIIRTGNQIIYDLMLSGVARERLPSGLIREHIGKTGVVSEDHSGGIIKVRAMAETSASKKKEAV